MGVDCGFDIYPPLEPTKANQEQYELFLREVLDTYGPRDSDGDGDSPSAEQGDGRSVVRVNAESEESYIDFEVGEHPHLPRQCEHFLRFSSKISGSSLAEPYIRGVYRLAKQRLGDRVYFWHEMNEFGPHVRRSGCYNWNEIRAARKKIGEHKQQAEERERKETKIQDEVLQGGDGTDRMADVPASRDGLYTIKPIAGKGLGFIATSKIPKGTRILLEVPLFKTPGSTEDLGSAEIIVLQEVNGLTKDQQRAFFALRNSQRRECTPVLGIVMSNMLPLGVSNNGGLFLEASRINHSCQPNAQHVWNDDLGHLTVHAVRDIEADREISISYISGFSPPYAERQHHLMDVFSFACACELCSLPLHSRNGSDYRLDQIRAINKDEGAAADLDQVLERPAKSLSQIHRLFELLEDEGICDIRIARACFDAFQIAAAAGDKARAKVFAERAYAARKVLAGDDNPTTIAFKHLARKPVDYPLYGKRFNCWDDSWEAPRGLCGEELENWLWNTDGWSRYSPSW